MPDGASFAARLGKAPGETAIADAERADALAIDLVRALARADALRDHRAQHDERGKVDGENRRRGA